VSKEWYINNPGPDYLILSKDRRVYCGLPAEMPIYDVVVDQEMDGKRVRAYDDPILKLTLDGKVATQYNCTKDLEKDKISYQAIKIVLHRPNRMWQGCVWAYKSVWMSLNSLQRVMYLKGLYDE
jgi:hypothetical protein